MTKLPLTFSLLALGSISYGVQLETIAIEAEKIIVPTKQSSEVVYTGSEVTTKGIELQGTRANSAIFEVIRTLPGINVESADDNGLNAEQTNLRVRGVSGSFSAMSIEGIPSYGLGPIATHGHLLCLAIGWIKIVF